MDQPASLVQTCDKVSYGGFAIEHRIDVEVYLQCRSLASNGTSFSVDDNMGVGHKIVERLMDELSSLSLDFLDAAKELEIYAANVLIRSVDVGEQVLECGCTVSGIILQPNGVERPKLGLSDGLNHILGNADPDKSSIAVPTVAHPLLQPAAEVVELGIGQVGSLQVLHNIAEERSHAQIESFLSNLLDIRLPSKGIPYELFPLPYHVA
ncbi:hypothetical protein BDK51DRAFT_43373 [Blyttiomyces helicus]|uniref:Uncharacterized protein n=1 Tax=Blyttiomyces helicus TaxID=388810 RepID=A0A4V1ISL0_9FUNG|nr:hypothetical protein BDK51DRAFT_43373 [Blyttiomyces helicus]|eukprot:RKO93927.1 hypothetical protein BDK51DRAFT_43373 [Blyttiomyces helicus]